MTGKLKTALSKGFVKLGHLQARVMLTLFFFVILTPYGLLVRCWKKDLLPRGDWQDVEGAKADIHNLRRSF